VRDAVRVARLAPNLGVLRAIQLLVGGVREDRDIIYFGIICLTGEMIVSFGVDEG
jgi:hypothetical protein